MQQEDSIHCYGAFIHGALAALHAIGFVYNWRRRQRWQAALHGGVLIYDVIAAGQHRKEVVSSECTRYQSSLHM